MSQYPNRGPQRISAPSLSRSPLKPAFSVSEDGMLDGAIPIEEDSREWESERLFLTVSTLRHPSQFFSSKLVN